MNPHGERAHALLSASGAERWLACPPSARLEDLFPETTNVYAEEGTAAHELGEYRLREILGLPRPDEAPKHPLYYNEDMEAYVKDYTDLVMEHYHAELARDPGTRILLEQRLDYSDWVPEGFGTGDVVIISEHKVTVIDLKYGKGKPVSADNNPQLKTYALGAISTYMPVYEFDEVEVLICQPRLDSVTSWSTNVIAILHWANSTVRPLALMAWNGEGEYSAGPWCTWCKANPQCQTLANRNLELMKYELRQAQLLTFDDIADILDRADDLVAWVDKLKEFALAQALMGKEIPGHKLVEGISRRAYVDDEMVIAKLTKEAYDLEAIAPRKLIGITAMEKLLSKKLFNALLGPLVYKPPGKPVLVKNSDAREPFNSAARDFEAIE